MFIESWLVGLLIVASCVVAIISLISGMSQDERLEQEREKNDELQEENQALRKEVARLRNKINLARLYVEMEKRK